MINPNLSDIGRSGIYTGNDNGPLEAGIGSQISTALSARPRMVDDRKKSRPMASAAPDNHRLDTRLHLDVNST